MCEEQKTSVWRAKSVCGEQKSLHVEKESVFGEQNKLCIAMESKIGSYYTVTLCVTQCNNECLFLVLSWGTGLHMVYITTIDVCAEKIEHFGNHSGCQLAE